MSSGGSIYCKDETTVASQLGLVGSVDPAPSETLAQIGPKRGEQASARAGENASVQGGK